LDELLIWDWWWMSKIVYLCTTKDVLGVYVVRGRFAL
jgi:hypothetical protein